MDAKAKAIEALEKAGCVFDSKEGGYIYYRRSDDYVIVDDHEVTFSVPLAEVPSFLRPSLSPEDQQRLEEIRGRSEALPKERWEIHGEGGIHMDGTRDWYSVTANGRRLWNPFLTREKAEFVAGSCEDIPYLLSLIDRLTGGAKE